MRKKAMKYVAQVTELSTEKVELNAAKELKRLREELDTGVDELMQYATDAREAISKGVRELNRLDAVYRVAKIRSKDVSEAAKELGVKIPEISELQKMISAYEQQRKTLTEVLK
jgi:predicted  nucleic acid-binding Zn-ribbon protein